MEKAMRIAGRGVQRAVCIVSAPGYWIYRGLRFLERMEAGGVFAAVMLVYFLGHGFYELYLDEVDFLVILAKNLFGFCFTGGFGAVLIDNVLRVLREILDPIHRIHLNARNALGKQAFRVKNPPAYSVCRLLDN